MPTEPPVNVADEITLERLGAFVEDIDPVPAAVTEAARDAFTWVPRDGNSSPNYVSGRRVIALIPEDGARMVSTKGAPVWGRRRQPGELGLA